MAQKKTKILLVEDNPGDVRLIEEMIKTAGANLYELVVVGTLDGALGRLRQEAFDAIFLDLSLPDSSGLATMKSVQGNAPHVALVVITGLSDEAVALEALKIGAEDFLVKGQFDGPILVRSLKYAITRKWSEDALRETKERYCNIFENTVMGISQALPDGRLITANNAYAQMYGYANAEEMMAEAPDVGQRYANPEDREEVLRILKEKGVMKPREIDVIRRNGTRFTVLVSAREIRDSNGNLQYYQAEHIDITKRKLAEEALKESEKQYRLLADNVHDVIFVLDMNLKYTYISPSVKILRGYEAEEVLKQQSIEHTLAPSSKNIAMKAFAEIMEMEKSGRREEIHQSRMLQLEMRRKDGTTVWTEVKFSFVRDKNNQPVGIMGVTRDISERKNADEKLLQTLERLKKAFASTVQVMVSAVEMRDPYTAGHQLRVSNLACAIANEMGLSNDTIEGIKMAGLIHDIGKLSIPAEILSKPTKLTNIEFSLIKEHPLSGYELLKNVESPWPLAQIVYQHHERMNGSGYPRNLKGDEILMEARIIAVADVVEAMASHRPYRPTMGIEATLEEIEKNKGILYDNVVADACLRLFREKGYQLK
jgi:PAS domain S-box-containing protein/putative nucleotidyltransferase with HDIG domain